MDLSEQDLKRIRNWVYRNARPVDLARWKFHFEKGPADAVLSALSAYQNEDGGFAHALEADSWNPCSAPIQTANAVEKLLEIHWEDGSHPVIQGILKYLDSGAEVEGKAWKNVVESNNIYPHAPWWNTNSNSTAHSMFNPTAILAGFILKYADRSSRLYPRGMEIARELSVFFLTDPGIEMHPLKCIVTLIECISEAGLQEQLPYARLQAAAVEQITALIKREAGEWSGYSCRPSVFIQSPESPGYADNAALLHKELDYLLQTRNEEGVWNLTWNWDAFEREFAISENWWKTHIVIENVLLLRAFGRYSPSFRNSCS
ncbi:hypothetical protein A3844_27065 [Paenibacillus helianthi]|uniref:Squalene cyclase C-terminal domain-containing protein n=1 Tax=Paenibacillus helianthi TaxID=1349432 RepID=A0ABX3EJ26_9BACL|nr:MULTISPECIES: hypothetical protein [Paenibacillus]OKP72212.1 hypothetical protein A3842_22950 [Paenibacillus sp. P3E]OKP80745.1 hypothetical protein A3844_27065 [Paenibacillus helianthi]OKP90307.1 hypothetical protein A3848_11270 [Paenibacillus sp. P32E]